MEEPEAEAFVDFANRDLHIHQVIPSATQEEVLFSCCPEAFPGTLPFSPLLSSPPPNHLLCYLKVLSCVTGC